MLPAQDVLEECSYPAKMVERICWLVGHHHTYSNVEELGHRVLLEADFLVNVEEGNVSNWRTMAEHVMRTKTGRHMFGELYGLFL